MFASAYNITIISINYQLMCTLHCQAITVYLNPFMAYQKQNLKAMVIKHHHVLNFPYKEICQTVVCLHTLCYRIHSDTYLIALTVTSGYQTQ